MGEQGDYLSKKFKVECVRREPLWKGGHCDKGSVTEDV